MKFVMHYRAPFTKQLALFDAVRAGAKVHGDEVVSQLGFSYVEDDADGLILYGIGGMSKEIHDRYVDAEKQVVFFDKGYMRGPYLRVAVNAFQPLDDLYKVKRTSDRFEALGLPLERYKVRGENILFDGASNKFCLWKGLGNWLDWGQQVINEISKATTYPIIYRPRPSHNADGTKFRIDRAQLSMNAALAEDFARTRVCVSYGGNIGWDCVLAGVPHFAIGDSIARPLSEISWDSLSHPYMPPEESRLQWLSNVCYWQWTLQELASGEAWNYIKRYLR